LIFYKDKDNVYLGCNKGFEEVYGVYDKEKNSLAATLNLSLHPE
jgi:hypothetical protein